MEATGSEVAKVAGGEIVVQDPFSPEVYHRAADVDAMIASARKRLRERRAAFDALGELWKAPLGAVRDLRKAVEADDAALRKFDADMKEALLDISGFKAFAVQTRGSGRKIDPLSVRGGFAGIVDALKTVEDAAKPDEPKHTYFYAVTATDAEHATIRKVIGKADPDFSWVAPQNDEQDRLAVRLFSRGDAETEGGAE